MTKITHCPGCGSKLVGHNPESFGKMETWRFACGAYIGREPKFFWRPAFYKIFEKCRTALQNGVARLNNDCKPSVPRRTFMGRRDRIWLGHRPHGDRSHIYLIGETMNERLERYVTMRATKPIRNIGDCVHAIHTGTEFAAELRLTDLQGALAEIERLRAIEKAARTYYHRYCQDEADEEGVCGLAQMIDARLLRDALAVEQSVKTEE